ncbi:hypothetical protein [Gloeobacter violaceus]|uniref:Glr0269 protein n=1 Tax=Gloeobacter violaceus (strain ATCC 29082 / PCC 7421) TaxID=251221 RepID=Q7NNY9_GLOVI|nr:hypothetical protein [Gloeobacter violaceus]BAC88210.1 glr0269 [Gloeobacter violaceus PCC 7421]
MQPQERYTLARRGVLMGGALVPWLWRPASTAAQSAAPSKYAGKILFSREPIVIGSENPAALTHRFSSKDNIYGVAYFAKSIRELGIDKSYAVLIKKTYKNRTSTVQDNWNFEGNLRGNENNPEILENRTFYLDISPDPADTQIFRRFVAASAYQLWSLGGGVKGKPISYTMDVTFVSFDVATSTRTVCATGSFSLDRYTEDTSRYLKLYESNGRQ